MREHITRHEAVEGCGMLSVAPNRDLRGILKSYDYTADMVTIALDGGGELRLPRDQTRPDAGWNVQEILGTPGAARARRIEAAATELMVGWWGYEIKTYTAKGQRLLAALRAALESRDDGGA